MPVREIQGYLSGKDMPAQLLHDRGEVKSLDLVHARLSGMESTASVTGADYDIPNEPAAYDQGDEGSCVINATCGAEDTILAVEGLAPQMPSRNFLYWLCRAAMGTTAQDSGTYTHLAVERVGNIGICSEKMWAYGPTTLYTPPSPQCYPEASDNKAKAWYQLTATGTARLNQLEATIRANHPVIYGAPVGQALQAYQAGQVLTIPTPTSIIGGHATCVVGIRYINGKRAWRIRNSWGTDFGDNGHFLIDDAYMSWSQLDDLWIMTRMSALLF
jgi:hypothetical protein